MVRAFFFPCSSLSLASRMMREANSERVSGTAVAGFVCLERRDTL